MNHVISDFMVTTPVTIPKEMCLQDVMNTMDYRHLSHLIVVNEDEDMVGVISKEDLLKRTRRLLIETTGKTFSSMELNSIEAGDIMSKDITSVAPDDPVDYAVELLLKKQFHCLPVVDNGKPIGIVTFFDLLKGTYPITQ